MTTLVIATLFPLDTVAAGDEANAIALARRARSRGIDATAVTVNRPDAMVDAQVYLLGGEGTVGVPDLVAHLRATDIDHRVRHGRATVVAVDAGLVALSRAWSDASGQAHPGLGLIGIDTRSTRGTAHTAVTRSEPALGLPAMIGWTSGTTSLTRDPDVPPLVQYEGPGTRPGAGADGVLADGVIGTLLHGPVLALNPELADLVLTRALGLPGLDQLPIAAVEAARAQRIAEATATPRRRPRSWQRGG